MSHQYPNVLAIIACGLGTRMSTMTGNNYIPKTLVNAGKQTVLAKILTSYAQQFDEVIVACANDTHAAMIYEHAAAFAPDIKLSTIVHDKADGSAKACADVAMFVANNIIGECNVFYHWSDVWLGDIELPLDKFKNGCITCCTSNDIDCRLHLIPTDAFYKVGSYADAEAYVLDHLYEPTYHSGIVGAYYVPAAFHNNVIDMQHNDSNADFADLMTNVTFIDRYEIAGCHSYGERGAFVGEAMKAARDNEARYFNSISIDDNVVTKIATTARGWALIQKEQKWYRHAMNAESTVIPLIFETGEDFIKMSKINGVTVHQFLNKVDIERRYAAIARGCMAIFKQSINELHASDLDNDEIWPVSRQQMIDAMRKEYIETAIARYAEVKSLVAGIKSFNGTALVSFDELMSKLRLFLSQEESIDYACENWSFIHGDPNTSNTMFNADASKCMFIDPRGYFGDVKMTGDIDYDIAKFAYGLSGYDAFNQSAYQQFDYVDGDVRAKVIGYNIDELDLTLRQKVLVALIWLKLPAYIKNNPAKAIVAYAKGCYMLQTLLA